MSKKEEREGRRYVRKRMKGGRKIKEEGVVRRGSYTQRPPRLPVPPTSGQHPAVTFFPRQRFLPSRSKEMRREVKWGVS